MGVRHACLQRHKRPLSDLSPFCFLIKHHLHLAISHLLVSGLSAGLGSEQGPVARPVFLFRLQLEEAFVLGWNYWKNKIFIENGCGFVHNASPFSPKPC